MVKKVKTTIKLKIPAGEANPAPPIGPALGQHGLNIMEFCKAYNERTADQKGNIIPVVITIYEDRTFSFITKTPPVSEMIKKILNLEKGSGTPQKRIVGKLPKEKAEEIAQIKMKDLNTKNLDQALKIVAGTAKSMGVEVEGI